MLKDTLIYGISSALTKFTTLILLPILTFHFSPLEFGIIDYFLILIQTFVLFLVFGLESSVARFFYQYEEVDERKELISQSIVLQSIFIFTGYLILYLFYDQLKIQANSLIDSSIIFFLSIAHAPFMVFINFSSSILKWSFNQKKFIVLSLGVVLSNFILISIGIFFYDISIEDFFIISLINNILFSIIGIFLIKEWLIVPSSFSFFKELFLFSAPLGLMSIFSSLTPFFERLIIINKIGLFQNGNFALISKLGLALMVIVSAFQTSWGPFSLSTYKNKDSIKSYNLILIYFTFGIFLAVLILSWAIPIFSDLIFSDKYDIAGDVLSIIFIGIALKGVSWILEIGISFSKKTIYYLIIYLVSFFIGLFSMYFLIDSYEIKGIAIGTCIGIISKLLMGYYFSQKTYPLKWEIFPALEIFVCFLVLYIAVYLLKTSFNINELFTYPISILAFLVYGKIRFIREDFNLNEIFRNKN